MKIEEAFKGMKALHERDEEKAAALGKRHVANILWYPGAGGDLKDIFVIDPARKDFSEKGAVFDASPGLFIHTDPSGKDAAAFLMPGRQVECGSGLFARVSDSVRLSLPGMEDLDTGVPSAGERLKGRAYLVSLKTGLEESLPRPGWPSADREAMRAWAVKEVLMLYLFIDEAVFLKRFVLDGGLCLSYLMLVRGKGQEGVNRRWLELFAGRMGLRYLVSDGSSLSPEIPPEVRGDKALQGALDSFDNPRALFSGVGGMLWHDNGRFRGDCLIWRVDVVKLGGQK